MSTEETPGLLASLKVLAAHLAEWDPKTGPLEIPDNLPPLVGLLGQLINALNDQWRRAFREIELAGHKRTIDLSRAYDAIQSKNEEMQRDLETARRIQHQLLPQGPEIPLRPELLFSGFYQSLDKVGGDLYDVIRIGKNAYALLVADVSGHGLPSALITMLVKAAFRTRSRWGVATDAVCREVNQVLHPIVNELGFFVTAFFGIIDLESGTLRYTNCGHNPALLSRCSKGELETLDSQGMILGPLEEVELEEKKVGLDPGDLLVVYTDGITESRNFLDEQYEDHRLENLVKKYSILKKDHNLPEAVVMAVKKDLRNFCMGAAQRDDQTLTAFQFLGRAEETHE